MKLRQRVFNSCFTPVWDGRFGIAKWSTGTASDVGMWPFVFIKMGISHLNPANHKKTDDQTKIFSTRKNCDSSSHQKGTTMLPKTSDFFGHHHQETTNGKEQITPYIYICMGPLELMLLTFGFVEHMLCKHRPTIRTYGQFHLNLKYLCVCFCIITKLSHNKKKGKNAHLIFTYVFHKYMYIFI